MVGFKHDDTARVFAAWCALREAGLPPIRSDRLVTALGCLLGRVLIVDLQGPECLPLRFVGSGIEADFGRPMRGMDLLDLFPLAATKQRMGEICWSVPTLPCGALYTLSVELRTDFSIPVEAMLLPLRGESGQKLVLVSAMRLDRSVVPRHREEQALIRAMVDFCYLDLGGGIPKKADGTGPLQAVA